jgi:glycogen operon protein
VSSSASRVWPGKPTPRGATVDADGINFAVFSRAATRVEICIFDPAAPERELERFDLPEVTGFTFHGYAPGLRAGTLYGLRVHGPYAPEQGHRCNPAKLLVDPYARATWGEVDWKQPVMGYRWDDERKDLAVDQRDDAAGVPKCVALDDTFDWAGDRAPDLPWRKTVLYEAHVRGLTKLHPDVPEELRGTYGGVSHPAVIRHLRELGVTAVQLLPVHEYVEAGYLKDRGLGNFWGYDTLAFFAPAQRYARDRSPGGAVREFKEMVKALHANGIEVILDVVYNHTCEGNHLGPTLSLRGIDNATYYWLMPEARYYLDFSGTGNSLRAAHPETARLIVDSLRYWVNEMHVDGFRFDLASTLGRVDGGTFDPQAPIFQIIAQDPVLSCVKLIAEPWDLGLGGYHPGNFPTPFREWNGKFRDAIRRYWKGDENLASELGYRLSGSPDLFQGERRHPQASVNFITAHDGFTLHDLVTYGHKHNEANGDENRDGADDNQSWNCGAEGEIDDTGVVQLRDRQKRNLLATLFLSQGVPMLLAGDELGRTQRGNNNAYCQDNELSWVDWRLDDRRRSLMDFTRRLIAARHRHPVLQRQRFLAGSYVWESATKDISWLRPDGEEMTVEDWRRPWISSLAFVLGGDALQAVDERGQRLVDDGVLVLMNAHDQPVTFTLPGGGDGAGWFVELDTHDPTKAEGAPVAREYQVAGHGLVLLRQPLEAQVARAAAEAPVRQAKLEAQRRRRRAGVLMPLFSIRTASGWGLGEIPDLAAFAGWARQAGFSVVQVLPVNAVIGLDASPYSASSAFALDRVYLSLDACEDFLAAGGREALPADAKEMLATAAAAPAVDWGRVRALKEVGIDLAFARFQRDEWAQRSPRARQLTAFMNEHRAWLEDYALFRVWHDRFQKSWLDWPMGPRERAPGAIAELRREEGERGILRVCWTQWQLDRQWRQTRVAASRLGVELMGDLPFVVGVDSADVWARPWLFRRDLHVGTPPEPDAPEGQDWGVPLYDWAAHAREQLAWFRERAERAGQLFALYRLDHAIGLFRTYYRSADGRTTGFSPPDEAEQVRLGEQLMRTFGHFGEIVAEDLGSVPPFLRPSLERLGVPGYRVLRWEKDGDTYRDPATWPESSVATNVTHDTDTTAAWYEGLSGEERERLRRIPSLATLDPTKPFADGARDLLLRAVYAAPSTLALVTFPDALGAKDRINTPGAAGPANWTFRAARTVDELLADVELSHRLRKLAIDTGRARSP